MSTYVRYTGLLTAGLTWLRARYGERLAGWIALSQDLIMEGARQATQVRTPDRAPYDALPHIGRNVQIERYAQDTDATYRARQRLAFPSWQQAGTRQAVLAQLAALGLSDAQLFEDHEWQREPQPYWSQFWLLFPEGTHAVGGSWTYGGGNTYGTGLVYGVTGITQLEVAALRALVCKWKRAALICREMIFATGPIYGTGLLYGGFTYGGDIATISGRC